jgi:RNA polymerase sporulation-specific sigma factor
VSAFAHEQLNAEEWAKYLHGIKGLDHDLLSAEEEQALAFKAQNGCVESRDRLVTSNLKLIWSEALKYRGEDVEELFLVGCQSALGAIQTFQPGKGRLAPYLRVVVRRVMWNARRPEVETWLAPWYSTEDDVRYDPEPYDMGEALEELVLLRLAEAELDPMDASVVALHYGLGAQEPLSQREVAAELGISRARVQQRLARAITQLRASFAAAGQQSWSDVLREIENE